MKNYLAKFQMNLSFGLLSQKWTGVWQYSYTKGSAIFILGTMNRAPHCNNCLMIWGVGFTIPNPTRVSAITALLHWYSRWTYGTSFLHHPYQPTTNMEFTFLICRISVPWGEICIKYEYVGVKLEIYTSLNLNKIPASFPEIQRSLNHIRDNSLVYG